MSDLEAPCGRLSKFPLQADFRTAAVFPQETTGLQSLQTPNPHFSLTVQTQQHYQQHPYQPHQLPQRMTSEEELFHHMGSMGRTLSKDEVIQLLGARHRMLSEDEVLQSLGARHSI